MMEPFEVFLNSMSGLSLPEQMFQCAKAVWRTTEKMQGVPPAPQPVPTPPPVPPTPVPPGSNFPPATWAKTLHKDGYWDAIADQWNPMVPLGAPNAWSKAAKTLTADGHQLVDKVSTAAIQQYPQDKAEIQSSYSWAVGQ